MRHTRLLAAAAAVLMLTGCGTPPWLDDAHAAADVDTVKPSATPTVTVAPAPSPTETEAPEAPAVVVQNDLAGGALDRTIDVGAATLDIRYWSEMSLETWTPSVAKPLSVRVTATAAASMRLGALRVSVDALVDNEWLGQSAGTALGPESPINADIRNPSSTIQTVMIGALPSGTQAIRLTFVFDATINDGITRNAVSGTDVVTIALAE